MSGVPNNPIGETTNRKSSLIVSKMILQNMTAILVFTYNAMSRVLSGLTTMSVVHVETL